MNDRSEFVMQMSQMNLNRVEQAISLLWYYRYTQAYEERTASELANDLQEEGLGKPNVTELNKSLTKSRKTVKGKRKKSFQINTKYLPQLNAKYEPLIQNKSIDESPSIIPVEFIQGTYPHLEQMVSQINASYNYTLYDCSAVLIRRLMESLIIEVFIQKKQTNDIRENNVFLPLERLIGKIKNNQNIILSRNIPQYMNNIKSLGDTAAHDRIYITQKQDIDEIKSEIRKTIKELLTLANIQPTN